MKKIQFGFRILVTLLIMLLAVVSVRADNASGTLEETRSAYFDSAGTVVLDFEDFQADPSLGYLQSYGLKFLGTGDSTINRINSDVRKASTFSGDYSIMNNANWPATSANDALEIIFNQGVSAVSFYLGNGQAYGETITATITAYGSDNKILGTLSKTGITKEVKSYVGFKSSQPIYKISVDYGNSILAEELDYLSYVPVAGSSSVWETKKVILQEKQDFRNFVEYRIVPTDILPATQSECVTEYNAGVCLVKANLLVNSQGRYDYVSLFINVPGKDEIQNVGFVPSGNYFTTFDALENDYLNLEINPAEMKLRLYPKNIGAVEQPATFNYLIFTRSYDKSAKAIVAKYVLENNQWLLKETVVSQLKDSVVISPGGSSTQQVYSAEMKLKENEITLFLSFYPETEVPSKLDDGLIFEDKLANGKVLLLKKEGSEAKVCSYIKGCGTTYGAHAEEMLYQRKGAFWTVYDNPTPSTAVTSTDQQTTSTGTTSAGSTTVSAPKENVPETCLSGCYYEQKCLPIGTRVVAQGLPLYCHIDGKMKSQFPDGSTCQNDYECLSNTCSDRVCFNLNQEITQQKNILEKIWDWLRNLF